MRAFDLRRGKTALFSRLSWPLRPALRADCDEQRADWGAEQRAAGQSRSRPRPRIVDDAVRRLVVERSHDLVTLCDLTGAIVYASPSWAHLGWEPADLVGVPIDRAAPSRRRAPRHRGVERGRRRNRRRRRHRSGSAGRRRASPGSRSTDPRFATRTAASLHARDGTRRERARGAALAAARSRRRLPLRRRRRRRTGARRGARGGARHADRGDRRRPCLGPARDDAGRAPLPRLARPLRPLPRGHRGHSPWPPDVEDPQPVLVDDVAAQASSRRSSAPSARRASARSRSPARPRRSLLGKFVLYRDEPHRVERPRGAALADDREPPRVGHRADARPSTRPRRRAPGSRSCSRRRSS